MLDEIERSLESASLAQQAWAAEIVRKRLKKIGDIAGQVAKGYVQLLTAIERPNASNAEKIASEILPLADACRFTATVGRRVLAPHSLSSRFGAWWLGRVGVQVTREPWGTILILAPSNYPLFLPGVQIIQALAAGNAVAVKPAAGGRSVLAYFKQCVTAAQIPEDLLQILPESIEAGQLAMRHGVDKVVLTGSIDTGKAVLRQLAESVTPATMELSGCDAMFVLPRADLERAVRAFVYALQLNGGATCIAPRRVFVMHGEVEAFIDRLKVAMAELPERRFHVSKANLYTCRQAIEDACAQGAELVLGELPDAGTSSMLPTVLRGVGPKMEIARSDLLAPVASIIQVEDMTAALAADRHCPYSLGASVFGPKTFADHWATRVSAGVVVINDVIVPTADPRVPFGGHNHSGWGLTRGAEGLLEMTRTKTICTRYGKWLPHLAKDSAENEAALAQILQVFHANGIRPRLKALRAMMQNASR